MDAAQFDLASLEISECIEGTLKHITNPDVDSVVRIVMPHIREQFNPSKQDYFRLLTVAKRLTGDALRGSDEKAVQSHRPISPRT